MTCSAVRCGAVRCGASALPERKASAFGRSQTGESFRPQKARQLSSIPVGPSARPRFVYRCATLRGSFVLSFVRRAPQTDGSRSTPLPALARHAVLPSIPCWPAVTVACHGSESLRRLTSSANSALPLRRRAKLQPQAYRALTLTLSDDIPKESAD
jgi:hypothetical protein